MTKAGNKILDGLKEVLAITKGESTPARTTHFIKESREDLEMEIHEAFCGRIPDYREPEEIASDILTTVLNYLNEKNVHIVFRE